MLGVRDFLNTKCGIPLTDMVGMRNPYLVHNKETRTIQYDAGLLYESNMIEAVTSYSDTTKSFAQRLWPYTMDFGIAQNCNWTYPSGQCAQGEKYPGLWSVPMWDMPFQNPVTDDSSYSMDPDVGFGGDLYTTLATNFDQAYSGNRAPFPIYVHAPWFTPDHVAASNKFIKYALTKPNVYFVTMRQLVQWMMNPVPASQVGAALTCKPVNLAAPGPLPPCQVYTIKTGEYMDLIAGKVGASVEDILSVNPGLEPATIQSGQKLKIPPFPSSCGDGVPFGAESATPSDAAPVPKIAPTKAPTPTGAVAATSPSAGTTTTTTTPAPTQGTTTTTTTPAQNRVDMDFVLTGYTPQYFESQEGQDQIMNVLAQLFEVFPDQITATATPVVSRRRRALLQDGASTGTTLKVHVSAATDTPEAVYRLVREKLTTGGLEALLKPVGLGNQGQITLAAYQKGEKMTIAAAPAVPATTTTSTTTEPESSGLSVGVIAGIAVGAGLLLIALIVAIVLLVKRRNARKVAAETSAAVHTDQFVQEAAAPPHVGGVASLRIKTSSLKGNDPFMVIKGEETPTSATYRANAAVNNTFRV